jgi:hypothetical protein
MITVPTWAAILVSIGSPVLTFTGVLISQIIARRGTTELEVRSRREETMRNLRWAAELAVSEDATRAGLGLVQLRALGDSEMLSAAQQLFVDAALAAAVSEVADEINEAGAGAQVIELVPPHADDVASERGDGEGGDEDG